MSVYDAPNQQVVRADGSGPGIEGGQSGGGGQTEGVPAAAATTTSEELDQMTKAELLAYAQRLGVSPANHDMTKDELRQGIDQHLAGA